MPGLSERLAIVVTAAAISAIAAIFSSLSAISAEISAGTEFACGALTALAHRAVARGAVALLGARPVDHESFALEGLSVEGLFRFACRLLGVHADECETAGSAREAVHYDFHIFDCAVGAEQFAHLIFVRIEVEVAYI